MPSPSKNIWTATADGESSAVQKLISDFHFTPLSVDSTGYNPLQAAVSYGNVQLLEKVFQPFLADNAGEVLEIEVRVMERLLGSGAAEGEKSRTLEDIEDLYTGLVDSDDQIHQIQNLTEAAEKNFVGKSATKHSVSSEKSLLGYLCDRLSPLIHSDSADDSEEKRAFVKKRVYDLVRVLGRAAVVSKTERKAVLATKDSTEGDAAADEDKTEETPGEDVEAEKVLNALFSSASSTDLDMQPTAESNATESSDSPLSPSYPNHLMKHALALTDNDGDSSYHHFAVSLDDLSLPNREKVFEFMHKKCKLDPSPDSNDLTPNAEGLTPFDAVFEAGNPEEGDFKVAQWFWSVHGREFTEEDLMASMEKLQTGMDQMMAANGQGETGWEMSDSEEEGEETKTSGGKKMSAVAEEEEGASGSDDDDDESGKEEEAEMKDE